MAFGSHVDGQHGQRPGRRRRGLVWPVTLVLLAAGLLPLALLSVLVLGAQERALTDRLSVDLGALADAQAARLELIGAAPLTAARLVASRTQLRLDLAEVLAGERTDLSRLETILRDAEASTPKVRHISLTDPLGTVIVSTDPAPPRLGDIVASLDLGASSSTVFATIGSPEARQWLIASPLVIDDVPIGAAVLELDLAPVAALVAGDQERGIRTCVYVRGADGSPEPLLAARAGGSRGCPEPTDTAEPPGAIALRGEEGLVVHSAVGTEGGIVAATRYLPGPDWGVTVSVSEAVLSAPVRELTRNLSLASLAVGVLAVLLAVLAARWVTGPVRAIEASTRSLAAGDAHAPADATAPGELGELAAAFNAMAASIGERQAALERDRADLQQRYAELELLTHAMAHDLAGPLTSVRGVFDLLAGGRAGDATQRQLFVERGGAAARRLERLIDDLLVLIRAIGTPLQLRPVDLGELVDAATEQLGLDEVLVRGPLPTVAGDRALLDHVVTNLLSNAAAYRRPDEPARIEVSARCHGHHVELCIDDAGPGIDEEERAAALEPFYRGAASGDRRGSGLGLPIAARVAARHGGSLRITDSPLGGTRIVVDLPTVSARDAPPAAPDAGSGSGSGPR
jgi:signal transduction histidine kinase